MDSTKDNYQVRGRGSQQSNRVAGPSNLYERYLKSSLKGSKPTKPVTSKTPSGEEHSNQVEKA